MTQRKISPINRIEIAVAIMKGETQQSLAKRLNATPAAISKIVTKPDFKDLLNQILAHAIEAAGHNVGRHITQRLLQGEAVAFVNAEQQRSFDDAQDDAEQAQLSGYCEQCGNLVESVAAAPLESPIICVQCCEENGDT